jgi:hypothetical protein
MKRKKLGCADDSGSGKVIICARCGGDDIAGTSDGYYCNTCRLKWPAEIKGRSASLGSADSLRWSEAAKSALLRKRWAKHWAVKPATDAAAAGAASNT